MLHRKKTVICHLQTSNALMALRLNPNPLQMSHKLCVTRTSFVSNVTPVFPWLNFASVELFFRLLRRFLRRASLRV